MNVDRSSCTSAEYACSYNNPASGAANSFQCIQKPLLKYDKTAILHPGRVKLDNLTEGKSNQIIIVINY